MLIVPASNVSVPLTVVMRTLSNVPESVFTPEENIVKDREFAACPVQTQVPADESSAENVIAPLLVSAAVSLYCINPVVAVPAELADPL